MWLSPRQHFIGCAVVTGFILQGEGMKPFGNDLQNSVSHRESIPMGALADPRRDEASHSAWRVSRQSHHREVLLPQHLTTSQSTAITPA